MARRGERGGRWREGARHHARGNEDAVAHERGEIGAGDVEKELSFSFDDLKTMDLIERDITLTCVSNDVGGPYVGGARWLGVRLTDLLDMAGVGTKADQILSTDVDGMTISTPLKVATDGRDAMIAIGMNGEALPREHGFPARMVVPGLYSYISAYK